MLPRLTRSWAGRVTFAFLICAALIGVVGLITDSDLFDFHLAIETLAVFAGITGVYAERRAAVVERRSAAIDAVGRELRHNVDLLDDDFRFRRQQGSHPAPRMYPRLDVVATHACLSQGALRDEGDGPLAQRLRDWCELATKFNRELNLAELVCYALYFANPGDVTALVAIDDQLQSKRIEMRAATSAVHSESEFGRALH